MTGNSKQRSIAVASLAASALVFTLSVASGNSVRAADKAGAAVPAAWDRQAAARYLDSRQIWWQGWDHAKHDHGTICVSCHTQVPFALARPLLRDELGEQGPSAAEKVMLANVEKRVQQWDQMLPFYSDAVSGPGKEVESRNAESVLNSIILASYDASNKKASETTRMAFEHAWALQSKTGPDAGAWVWQNFNYAPWEGTTSQYYFAAQMAVAAGVEPGRDVAEPKPDSSLGLLLDYLRGRYEAQPLVNKVVALWADRYYPGVVTPAQERTLMEDLNRLQHADGGWSLTDLGTWARKDKTSLETRSDGFATALIVLVREERAGDSDNDPQVARGIAWLVTNQDKNTGAWRAWSLNKNRDPASDAGPFMTDAATGYAVLALEARR